jgi:uncharacterized cupin superfamily protein
MDRTSVSRREFMFATRPAQSLAYVGGQPPKGLRGFGVRPRRSGTWQATSGRSKGAYRGSEELELVVGTSSRVATEKSRSVENRPPAPA